MIRLPIEERPDWREKADEYGFQFHTMYDERYWCEDAYYQFSLKQVEAIEDATNEIHQMCLEVVDKVANSEELLEKFQIPRHCREFVRDSWISNQPSLYSRLDFAFDGYGPAKLLENNADTPTSLYESAFFQWLWLEDQVNAGKLPQNADQFNSIQEKLIERFAQLKTENGFNLLHFACCQDSDEDRGTVQYLQDCANDVELANEFLFMEEIGLGEKGQFTDLDNQVISNLFKLYPWEFMFRDIFSTKLTDAGVRWLEPAWKSILSNKALLPMLWQMFPNHPNLLPAYFADDKHTPHMSHYVRKPLFSREGANIQIVKSGQEVYQSKGPYGEEGMIIQAFHQLPKFNDSYTLVGSWLVNDEACGICLREDHGLVTQDLSRFYPHIILD